MGRGYPLTIRLGGLGERLELPQRGLGGAPADFDFGAYYNRNLVSGGNNYDKFSMKQETSFVHSFSAKNKPMTQIKAG